MCTCKNCIRGLSPCVGPWTRPKKFYIQDKRQVVGNCMLLWKKEGMGYTTNLDEAWLVDASWCGSGRTTDVPWPEEVLKALAKPRVDVQSLPDRAQLGLGEHEPAV